MEIYIDIYRYIDIHIYIYTYIYIPRKDSQIRERKALHVMVMAKENK